MRIAIIGGGLAGLSLSILLAEKGYSVDVFEAKKVQRHKVCGEYISRESIHFLERLGIDLTAHSATEINRFRLTSQKGADINRPLSLGGAGISRFKLEGLLLQRAQESGVEVHENCRIKDLVMQKDKYQLLPDHNSFDHVFAAWGKRSNLDRTLDRPFYADDSALSGFLGVKYHVKGDHAKDMIELHNFKGGYCGFSAIEDDLFCLCYLVSKQQVNIVDNSIDRLEQEILFQNKALASIFEKTNKVYTKPLVISNVSFVKKVKSKSGLLMLGDSGGLIAPLSGNGMSIAFHTAQLAFDLFHHQAKRGKELEDAFLKTWDAHFSGRHRLGRTVQYMFGKGWLTESFINAIKPFPAIADLMIKNTHGKSF